jgi:hypothetical protein
MSRPNKPPRRGRRHCLLCKPTQIETTGDRQCQLRIFQRLFKPGWERKAGNSSRHYAPNQTLDHPQGLADQRAKICEDERRLKPVRKRASEEESVRSPLAFFLMRS